MAHNEHNKPKKSGAYFLIILGALLFMIAPTFFLDAPQTGLIVIVLGFIVGGFGFYLRFVKK
jgi:uncharacterized membrane-anchored protein